MALGYIWIYVIPISLAKPMNLKVRAMSVHCWGMMDRERGTWKDRGYYNTNNSNVFE